MAQNKLQLIGETTMQVIAIVLLIIGILVVLGTIAWDIVSHFTTPPNLRGFYGKKYIIFTVFAAVGGIALIVAAFLI